MPSLLGRLRWALAWAALILALCLMPGAAVPSWHWADLFNADKLVHFALFAVLAILALKAVVKDAGWHVPALAMAAVILYGGLLEAMQMLTALGRRGDWNDAAANALGALGGWGFHRWRALKERPAGKPIDA
jgi:VanZ family protein